MIVGYEKRKIDRASTFHMRHNSYYSCLGNIRFERSQAVCPLGIIITAISVCSLILPQKSTSALRTQIGANMIAPIPLVPTPAHAVKAMH